MGLGLLAVARVGAREVADSTDATAPGEDCVVAEWDDGRRALTHADVVALSAAILPSPSGDEAKRWALDVHLAAWDLGAPGTPRELLAAHRAWLGAHGFDLDGKRGDSSRLREARERLFARARLVPGDCAPDGQGP